ncbi:MAG: TPM domain-containing protein [Xanthobacteraceae bacterium]|nr:TPM domain-containing protein [Xanthobacteraceae bacterium]
MGITRLCRHLLANRSRVRRAFPRASLDAIEQAIKASEAAHAGQIRFVVEGALDGRPLFRDQPARERALDLFSRLRIWDTAHNSGVLIYVLLADRNVEIIADRGIDAAVGHAAWQRICDAMEREFGAGRFEQGVLAGIAAVTEHLVAHFPKRGDGRNELPDAPVVL